MNDITLVGEWRSLGLGALPNEDYDFIMFAGVFNGNNKTIKNMMITSLSSTRTSIGGWSDCYAGLFFENTGTISNLKLTNININLDKTYASEFYVGGVTGVNYGNISDCEVSGNISLNNTNWVNYVGGISGVNTKTISRCFNSANIIFNGGEGEIGGIARRML